MTMSRNKRTAVAFAPLLVLLAVALSTSASSASSGRAKDGAAPAATPLAQLRKELQAAMAPPKFKPFGGPINITRLRGKKITFIPFAASPQNQVIGDTMRRIGKLKRVGVNVSVCNNRGTPAEWNSCLQQAVTTKQDLVVLNGAPVAVGPSLRALKAAGIPVLSQHYFPEGVSVTSEACVGCAAGITAVQPAPFRRAAKLMADWAIVDSKGKANVLITILPGFAPTDAMVAQFKREFAKCSGCTYEFLSVSVQDILGTGFQTAVASALNKNPNVRYIIDEVAVAVPATLSALNITGRTNVKVATRGGDTGELDLLQQGTALHMDVGGPSLWIAYLSMDNAFRVLLGKPTNPAPNPVRVFTRANVKVVGDPPSTYKGYGTSWIQGYLKLWGLG
jgi:ribose transport system substrate-binding protein